MTEEQLKTMLDKQLAAFFGQLTTHIDERLGEFEGRVSERLDHMQTTVDGVAKRLETDEQERIAIAGEVQRHGRWIEQLADATGTKLAAD